MQIKFIEKVMAMLNLSIVKSYLRVDGNAEDDLINILISAADNYVKNAITNYEEKTAASAQNDTDNWNASVDLYKLRYIAYNYENRTIDAAPKDRLLAQLQAQGRAFKNG